MAMLEYPFTSFQYYIQSTFVSLPPFIKQMSIPSILDSHITGFIMRTQYSHIILTAITITLDTSHDDILPLNEDAPPNISCQLQ